MIQSILCLAALSLLVARSTASSSNYLGCYNNPGGLTSLGSYSFQSTGYCSNACSEQGYPVYALHNGDQCFCGNKVPPADSLVETSKCDLPCVGFVAQNCGGATTWSVFLEPSTNLNDLSNSIATEIITASDDTASGSNPTATFSVNPTVVETGIQIATNSDQQAVSSIIVVPSSILTAPSTGSDSGGQQTNMITLATTTAAASSTTTAPGASGAAATPTTAGARAAIVRPAMLVFSTLLLSFLLTFIL